MKYDIAIIGGGPAGMMAAGRAGELGARVVLVEKNVNLGTKLLMTGNGRCNITNLSDDPKGIAAKFGKNGRFLFSALNLFSAGDAVAFFRSRGLEIKVEEQNKAYPASDKAHDVLDALQGYMEDGGVEIRSGSNVADLEASSNAVEYIKLENGEKIEADKFIIATGGLSYPQSGSTGDGFNWAKKLGHSVSGLYPALTPIIIEEGAVADLEGLSLRNADISIYKNSKKIDSRRGEAIFTKNGMSGPAIIDLSKRIGKELPGVILKIDLKPELDFDKLDKLMQQDFYVKKNKLFRNSFDRMLPKKMIPVVIRLSGIDPVKKVNSISKDERKKILHLIKEFTLTVKSLAGFEKAVVTSGGVKLREIDPRTMRSKIMSNLFFAGEILDLDGPTGGFNLQMCWSTGRVAGENAAKKRVDLTDRPER
ncbi:MAG: NAD(P)/FAD-dependent oxidoreductase [Candidatus Paceibacterota bacterium]|jgi:hypothetical protein